MLDIEVLLALYLCGWVVATRGLSVAAKRFCDSGSPVPHALWLSVFGGAAWPLVLIVVIEFSSLAVYAKVRNRPGPGIGNFA